ANVPGQHGIIDLGASRRIMDVNYMGALNTTAAALPSLTAQHGLIVAISSLQGLFGFPGSAAYSASKHAMQCFFGSLRMDLERDGLDVLVVSPGPVATAIHNRDSRRDLSDAKVASRSMPVEVCAKLIADACAARRRELVMTAGGRLAFSLRPFFPAFVDR